MTYATQQDLVTYAGETEIIQLSDRSDPPAYAIDAGVVAQALGEADDEINGYVAAKYRLPLTAVPSLLKTCAIDIARYRLFRASPTEEVASRYKDAVARLREIRDGRVKLDLPETGENPASREGVVLLSTGDRRFSRDSMDGF